MAVIWSLIGMLVYIGFRFKLEYGVSAIITLTQDVLMALSGLLLHQPRDQTCPSSPRC